MGSDHSHTSDNSAARIRLTLVLVIGYMLAEVIGGLWSNSLALLADAGHMFSDAGALTIALIAMRIAQRPASATHTFGYRRAEVLAALANGAALVGIASVIGYQAVHRLGSPPHVEGPTMLGIAAGGLAVNLAGLYILHGDKSDSLNVRGAWLHVMADALGSMGAIVSGVLVTVLDWRWADPAASLLIASLVVYSAWLLIRQTTSVLMQSVPDGIDLAAVERSMLSVEGVTGAHDLHIWALAPGRPVMSAHLTVTADADRARVMSDVHERLRDHFDLHHSTIQIDCPAPCDAEA